MWDIPLITGRPDYYYNVYYSQQDQPERFRKHNSMPIEDKSSSIKYNVTNLTHDIYYTIRVEVINGVSDQDPQKEEKKCEIENITPR